MGIQQEGAVARLEMRDTPPSKNVDPVDMY